MFHSIVFVVTDSRDGKPYVRNTSQMGFNVADAKGVDAVHAIVKKVVDERRGRGKPGPFALYAYGVNGKVTINPDSAGLEGVVGGVLIDNVGNLTQADIDAMKREWDHEQDRLAVLAGAGVLASTI